MHRCMMGMPFDVLFQWKSPNNTQAHTLLQGSLQSKKEIRVENEATYN